MSLELEDIQPVPPQMTIWRLPSFPENLSSSFFVQAHWISPRDSRVRIASSWVILGFLLQFAVLFYDLTDLGQLYLWIDLAVNRDGGGDAAGTEAADVIEGE